MLQNHENLINLTFSTVVLSHFRSIFCMYILKFTQLWLKDIYEALMCNIMTFGTIPMVVLSKVLL